MHNLCMSVHLFVHLCERDLCMSVHNFLCEETPYDLIKAFSSHFAPMKYLPRNMCKLELPIFYMLVRRQENSNYFDLWLLRRI